MGFRNIHPVKIEKKWGHELCVVTKHPVDGPAGYSGKILTLDYGWQCSIHYHVHKTETFFVLEGKLVLELYDLKASFVKTAPPRNPSMDDVRLAISTVLEPGQGMTLDPLTPHRFWTVTLDGCKFVEFSTPDDPSDSYRITTSGPKDAK